MRALTGAKRPDKPAHPIMVQPDVRRMLLTCRAPTSATGGGVKRRKLETARLYFARLLSRADQHPAGIRAGVATLGAV
jgi:hypothetical protein